jgi:hypothetical protein
MVNRLERQADNLQLPIADINNSLSSNFATQAVVLNQTQEQIYVN